MKQFLLFLFLCFAPIQSFGQAKKDSHPDFGGTWYLTALETNNKIPDFRLSIKKDKLVEVSYSDPSFHIITKKKEGEKYIVISEDTYYTDKRGETNVFKTDGQPVDAASTTQWDGKKIVITFKLNGNKNDWELSSDGTKLINRAHIKTQFDKFYIELIFSKIPQE